MVGMVRLEPPAGARIRKKKKKNKGGGLFVLQEHNSGEYRIACCQLAVATTSSGNSLAYAVANATNISR